MGNKSTSASSLVSAHSFGISSLRLIPEWIDNPLFINYLTKSWSFTVTLKWLSYIHFFYISYTKSYHPYPYLRFRTFRKNFYQRTHKHT